MPSSGMGATVETLVARRVGPYSRVAPSLPPASSNMMSKSQERPESTLNCTERKRPAVHGTRICSLAPAATHVPLLCSSHRVSVFCEWEALIASKQLARAGEGFSGPRSVSAENDYVR